ncbi:hypothetical protein HZY88_02330 [Aerococcaceae bacterium DSM 111176]|nr:hypothetical protein [Aerococcaceae bacterium DSM 111176]
MFFLRIFSFLYGALSLLSIAEQIFAGNFHWSHLLYPIFALCLIYVAIQSQPYNLFYIGFIGLIFTAIIGGVFTSTFDWRHIIVRTIITLIVLWPK